MRFRIQHKAYSHAIPIVSSRRQQILNRIMQIDREKPFPNPLTDSFGRQHTYLRISLTEKCNLRCTYCMPEEGVPLSPSENLLTSKEISHLAKLFVEQGINKIRLTGGEPTVRKEFMDIVRELNELKEIGLKKIGITTNGIALKRKLPLLRDYGLDQINISLDTLDPFQFELMTRRKGHNLVLDSIHESVEHGFEVKINVVIINNVNNREIPDFIEMTKNLPIYVRFIEYMPFDGNRWNSEKFLSMADMMKNIENRYTVEKLRNEANDTSKGFKVAGYEGKFGFISSMSDHFCGTCNRLRLLADGNLKVCLFGNNEVNLKELMRSNTSNEDLISVINAAVLRKKKQHAGMHNLAYMPNRPMILIGG